MSFRCSRNQTTCNYHKLSAFRQNLRFCIEEKAIAARKCQKVETTEPERISETKKTKKNGKKEKVAR